MLTDSVQFKHYTRQKEYQRTPHFHDVNELLFSLNEDSTMLINQHTYHLQEGSLILIPRGTLHQKFNNNSAVIDSYVIHYDASILKALSTDTSNLHAAYAECACCINLRKVSFSKIYELFQRFLSLSPDSFGYDIACAALLAEILIAIYPLVQLAPSADKGVYFHDDAQLGPVLSYLDEHLTEKISLDSLADRFYMNKYTLAHNFKKKAGITIVTYVNMNRVRLSCMLLKQDYSVKEAAEKSGFSSTENFIRTFSAFVGTTPGKYQQSMRKSKNIPIGPTIYKPS